MLNKVDENKCIICGSNQCSRNIVQGNWSIIKCKAGFNFVIDDSVFNFDEVKFNRISNLIVEKLVFNPELNSNKTFFYYDPSSDELIKEGSRFNLYVLLRSYPSNVVERMNRSLLVLSKKYPVFGDNIGNNILDKNLLFVDSSDYLTETKGVISMLEQMGYLIRANVNNIFTITANGWLKIESLQKDNIQSKQVFIAMSFRAETNYIRDAFKVAIRNTGYIPFLIDEKEHNNQIVPEILFEIRNSKFMIVDITFSNNGAYYEAGYAFGLGKEVIVCCNKKIFDGNGTEPKPHFDISQKNLVIWEDINDLETKLTNRINATI